MMLTLLLAPALIMFLVSLSKNDNVQKILPLTVFLILLPIGELMILPKPFPILGEYLVADKLSTYVLLISSIVAIGVTLALMTLKQRVTIARSAYRRFYRFFALFWVGLILSILANHMGLYWIGLEMATLSTVYMIKTHQTDYAHKQAWNYMIVGAIAISLVLFGIILIYASAKPILGEEAMQFDLLLQHANEIQSPFMFELGFAIVTVGMFVKMGFFPMNLWLPNIERAAFYPVAALFSGILESAILIGFFRFSHIAMAVDYSHLFVFVFVYVMLTIFIVAFLIYRAKDFVRLFSLSGIEHTALIVLFWISGGPFAALLHLGAHAFLKPALFLSTGVLESHGKYQMAGTLKGFVGKKGWVFSWLVVLFMLAIISLPPSPMFFSELYGFSAMIELAKQSHFMLGMIGAVLVLLILLSIIFYRFVEIYQSMRHEGTGHRKEVYLNEVLAMVLFGLSLMTLLLPSTLEFIRSIA
ncbi:proton-conducting transporter transmembrane domain-containing protein [Galenea microaerophila]